MSEGMMDFCVERLKWLAEGVSIQSDAHGVKNLHWHPLDLYSG